jgi:hypothetical protein
MNNWLGPDLVRDDYVDPIDLVEKNERRAHSDA